MFRSKVLLPLMRYYQDRFKNFYATALGKIARRGYRLKNPSGWVDMTKWVQNPDYLNSTIRETPILSWDYSSHLGQDFRKIQ
ncbi:unnamed protein product [Rhizophagus irregularis]|uniref:Uncharacterized protein n=1 Tax=Rhizophagus irregularis TaxID=588596 RepID=A0A915ZEE0_9GLOM|nr:unnamed protein product [Rhizophagus irregularis]CAB5373685.1 unnamed protein product [Rhizophagus irregularis]